MGLDMYIRRESGLSEEAEGNQSYEVWKSGELAYWRKHPDLHGYIVEQFGGGVDECQKIPLNVTKLRNILKASEADLLPHTEGFFFGVSRPEDKDDTREQITRVIDLLKADRKLKVYYQASW